MPALTLKLKGGARIWCDHQAIPELPQSALWRVSVSIEPAAGSPNCRWLTSPAPVVAMSWDQDVSASKLQASSSAERRRFIRAAAVLRARLLTPQGTVEATVLDASLNGVKLWTSETGKAS